MLFDEDSHGQAYGFRGILVYWIHILVIVWNTGIVIIFWLPETYIWQLSFIYLIISSRSSCFYWVVSLLC